jgi:hypothetical protein
VRGHRAAEAAAHDHGVPAHALTGEDPMRRVPRASTHMAGTAARRAQ